MCSVGASVFKLHVSSEIIDPYKPSYTMSYVHIFYEGMGEGAWNATQSAWASDFIIVVLDVRGVTESETNHRISIEHQHF